MADKRDILIRLLGEETVSRMADRAGDGLDRFGKSLDATEHDAQDLDRQIAEVEGSLKTLAVAFARTGDAADRIDITKAIRRQQTELRKLTKAKDLLDFDRLGDEAAHGFAARFGARLGPLMASGPIGSGAAAAGVALSAAMAPTLLAGLSGAVVGGAGLGGIVGGALIAARDPRVKAAGADLGQYILGDLEDRAAGFVPVMLGSIDKVRAGWADLGPDLDRIFASSRLVDPLVNGMVSGSKKLIHGVADAVDKADPVVRAFGRGMDRIGDAAGDVFTTLADDADEGASAIDDLTGSIESFIRVSGAVIHAGATVKGWTNEVDVALDKGRYWIEDNSALGEGLRRVGIQLDLTADGFKAGSVEAEAYRAATLGTAEVADFAVLKQAGMTDAQIAGADASGTYRGKLDEVNNALGRTGPAVQPAIEGLRSLNELYDDWSNKSISVEEANIRLEEAIDNATEAAKRNGAGIDANKPKQRDNRQALVDIANAAKAAAEKIYAQTGSQEAASVATERGRTKFLGAAAAMKVEKGEAIALANKLFGIPNVDRSVSIQTAKAQAAIARVQASLGKIKDIHRGIYYTVKGDLKLPGGTSIKGAASGGPVTGSGPKGIDSVPMVLAPGEHVLTAREVDAAGGHAGVERLRAMLRGGGPGGAVAASAGRWGPRPGGGGSAVNLYATFNVNVPPNANLAEVGRQNALALDAWARANGIRWRAAS